jgi:broad specificity phosphatase PhoE
MSLLVLVRHGKASSVSVGDYDKLSPPGIEQSDKLGDYWVEQRFVPTRVFVGPRTRHQETYARAIAKLQSARIEWPAPERIRELDEHDGINLVFRTLPQMRSDPRVGPIAEQMARGETPTHEDVLAAFRVLTRQWAKGELDHPEVESWKSFRARVVDGLRAMTEGAPRASTIVAFTSGGFVAAAIGHALALDDEKVLDLSWALHNGAISELAFSESSFGLRSFNGVPHLREARLVTSV